MSEAEVPTVFIHGVKGSFLRYKDTKKIAYLSSWQAINLHGGDLGLPLKWSENEQGVLTQDSDNVEVAGPMDKLKLGFLTVAKIYDPFLEFAKNKLDRPFYPFSYDWRRDNHESMHKFIEFLREVSEKHKSPVQIVAHSMGGVITMGVLRENPELVHSVLFAGVPFGSGITYLEDMTIGSTLGLNSSLLTKDVMFSFPSSFTFFPADEQHALECDGLFVDENGDRLVIDLFDPEQWLKHKFSVFADGDNEDALAHLQAGLASAKAYRLKYMKFHPDIKYPKMAALAADTVPCKLHVHLERSDDPSKPSTVKFTSQKEFLGDGRIALKNATPYKGMEHLIFKEEDYYGDGRLYFKNAKPYGGMDHRMFKARKVTGHQSLLNDTELVKEIIDHLMEDKD